MSRIGENYTVQNYTVDRAKLIGKTTVKATKLMTGAAVTGGLCHLAINAAEGGTVKNPILNNIGKGLNKGFSNFYDSLSILANKMNLNEKVNEFVLKIKDMPKGAKGALIGLGIAGFSGLVNACFINNKAAYEHGKLDQKLEDSKQ